MTLAANASDFRNTHQVASKSTISKAQKAKSGAESTEAVVHEADGNQPITDGMSGYDSETRSAQLFVR